MMESLIKTLSISESIAIVALLLGNVAQALFILLMRKDHAAEREKERQERVDKSRMNAQAMEKLSEVITQLRVVIASCGLKARD